MTPEERKRRAQMLLSLRDTSEGRLHLGELQADYDAAMKALLFAEPDNIFRAQGTAQAYHSIFKKFDDAKKELGG